MKQTEKINGAAAAAPENTKTGIKAIIGYGFASAADSTSYNFAFMFLLYFLTTAAGINPAVAGIMMMVATIVDAVLAPFIGNWSDNCMSKYGRRRPFILIGGLVLAAAVVLLFTDVPFEGAAKVAYYMVLNIVFWLAYSTYYVPYTAFGAEVAVDYDSRTKLRTSSAIFNGLGNLLGMSSPMLILMFFMSKGMSQSASWSSVAGMVGIVVLVTILLTWTMTKGRELKPDDEVLRKQKSEGMLSTYLKVIRLKPYKFIVIACIFFIAAYTLMMTDMIYYITYVMQASETVQSQATLVFIISVIVLTPVVSFIAIKIGKKLTVALCYILSAVLMVVFRFVGIDSVIMLDIYLLIFAVCNCAYWTLIIAMMYDISEVYEVKYKEQREGAVQSLNLFFVKASCAVISGITGSVLAFTGFDASSSVQSASAISGITNLFTVVPAILILIAGLIILRFPLTKEKHEMLVRIIDEGAYDEEIPEELKDIL